MQVEILDGIQKIYSGEATRVHCPGDRGHFDIQEDHAPLLSLLKKGTIIIEEADRNPISIPVESGIVKTHKNKVTAIVVLAGK